MHIKVYLLGKLILEAPNPFVLPKLCHRLIMTFQHNWWSTRAVIDKVQIANSSYIAADTVAQPVI